MNKRWVLRVAVAAGFAVPGLAFRISGFDPGPLWSDLVYGAAIASSAFLLVWAAEAAEKDISSSLAIALLALIAVLPEYAVDLYFAFSAGTRPAYTQYAAANMTGSNRLLIGLGWPAVVLVYFFAARNRGRKVSAVLLEPKCRIELAFLAVASLYCFTIPLRSRLGVLDAVVLLALFSLYMWRLTREEQREPVLVGTAALLAAMPKLRRRAAVISLFLMAAVFVLSSARPFADSLVETGRRFHIDEFLLVQWLAPLASEAPELIAAAILAARLKGGQAIGILLSSKVNQWTLLVGSLPVAFLLGGGGAEGLPLDARQNEEVLLTAAQTVLGFSLLAHLHFGLGEGLALLVLFLTQFAFPQESVRVWFACAYVALGTVFLIKRRSHLFPIVRALLPVRAGRGRR